MFTYVRTRPFDRQRVLLTEDDAGTVQREWELLGGAIRVPEGTEIAKLNQELRTHAASRNWGLYRNAKLLLSAAAESQFRWRDIFRGYLEVCYIDINGPNNGGPVDFDPTAALLAPALVERLTYLASWFHLSEDDVHQQFIDVSAQA